ncbi:hypothetical protein FNAPI_10357 [Fusarium napiforme]|uniref:Uncharacterized protein n=1 Tax=Fusarium napiforme TaxID=42672 RepID=A0A8H5IS98_9HYPO|nr:hypothetical protein FNAPI_10357 [Fusarium napiforme]
MFATFREQDNNLDPRPLPRDHQVRHVSLDVVYGDALLARGLASGIGHLTETGDLATPRGCSSSSSSSSTPDSDTRSGGNKCVEVDVPDDASQHLGHIVGVDGHGRVGATREKSREADKGVDPVSAPAIFLYLHNRRGSHKPERVPVAKGQAGRRPRVIGINVQQGIIGDSEGDIALDDRLHLLSDGRIVAPHDDHGNLRAP